MARPEAKLAPGSRVPVVLHDHSQARPALEDLAGGDIGPVQVWRPDDRGSSSIDCAGDADAHPRDLLPGSQLVDHVRDNLEHLHRAISRSGPTGRPHDLPLFIHETAEDLRPSDVHADRHGHPSSLRAVVV
jgi:hypothetical protein